ncbi:MAG: hypothetical protein WC455_20175 [Dehalococcoidia bacterium]|jgi:hypothetical protein
MITPGNISKARREFIASVQELNRQRPDLAALRETPFGSDEDFEPERFMVASDA